MENEDRSMTQRVLTMALALTAERDRHAIFRRFIESATEITESRYGAIGILDDEGETSDFIWTGLSEEIAHKIGAPPEGYGVFGHIPDEHYLIVNDLATFFDRHPWPEHHPVMKNFLGVPIRVGDRVFGRLYLSDKEGGYSRIDGRNCALLGQALAVAVTNEATTGSSATSRTSYSFPTKGYQATGEQPRFETEEALEAIGELEGELAAAQQALEAKDAEIAGLAEELESVKAELAEARKANEEMDPEHTEVFVRLCSFAAEQLDRSRFALTATRSTLSRQPGISQPALNQVDAALRAVDDSTSRIRELISTEEAASTR